MRKINIFLVFLIFIALLFSCKNNKSNWYDNLSKAEEREFTSGDIPEDRVKNLEKGISFYQKEVERTVKASKEIGVYYRMLALEYFSLEMYNEALKNLEAAIEYFPVSSLLYYKAAVASGQMSLATDSNPLKDEYLKKAEFFYKRAISIEPDYKEALYGLSVLYIFEIDSPLQAEPLLEKLIKLDKSNIDARFLLARVRIIKGEIDSAADIYSYIEKNARDDSIKQKARDNRMKILGNNF